MGWFHSSSPISGPQGGSGGGIGWVWARHEVPPVWLQLQQEGPRLGSHRWEPQGAPAHSSYGANSTPITESMKSTKWFDSTLYMPA